MYPLKFENIYFEKIWGGRNFEKFRNNLPYGKIGESWDLACHKNGMSKVANGVYKGFTLEKLIDLEGEKIIGTKLCKEKFPLLIKLIDAEDRLSIQVHPDNAQAEKEGEMGKTEMWYIIEAEKGAKIVLGIKPHKEKLELEKAIETTNIEKYINEISVSKGQVFFVKSGLIHAIGKGIILTEIQQSSDTTYRVYDYNRGRQLNVEKALEAMDLTIKGEESRGLMSKREGYNKTYLCLCKEFCTELYEIKSSFKEASDKERFYVFTCVEGDGKIYYKEDNFKMDFLEIKMGESMLIPADLGEYIFEGNMKLLKSYVPDVDKVRKEILKEVEK